MIGVVPFVVRIGGYRPVNISRPGNGPWGMLRAGLMHTPAATRYEDRSGRHHTAVDAPQYRATAGTRRGTQLCVLRGSAPAH